MIHLGTKSGRVALASALTTAVIGAAVLLGWGFDLVFLTNIFPRFNGMNPATACAFVLAGLSLSLFLASTVVGERWAGSFLLTGRFLAFLFLSIGLIRLLDFLCGWDSGVDRWLFPSKFSSGEPSHNRMALSTALNFFLLGGAFLLLDRKSRLLRVCSQAGVIVVMAGAFLALLGYLYDIETFYGFGPFNRMALHTAFTFLVVGLAFFLTHTDRGLPAIFAGSGAGGVMARWLLPAAVLIPTALGGVILHFVNAGVFHGNLGDAVFVLGNVLAFTVLICWSAARLTAMDLGWKKAEATVRENEERFTGAFQYAPIGVALVSPEGRWMKVNGALCEMLGYSESELLRCSFQDVTHPDDLKDCLECVRQLSTGELKTCQSEKRYIHRDGHFVPVSFNLSLVRDDAGKPRYLIAQIQDITERKLAREKHTASEILLRQFVQYTPAAIAMLDRNMCYIQVSDRWIKDYHLEGRDIIGKSHYELFPEAPQRWKDIHQRVLAGAVENCAEDPFPRTDGSVDWLQWEARPWREPGGAIGGLIFFTQVITDRKEREEQVRFNEQRYRSLTEATTAIVWDTPASGRFEREQPAWSAFTGQSFEELRGWGWLDAVHPDDQKETSRIWSLAVANRSPYECEHRLRTADGTYHDMTVRGVPIFGENGEIRQWMGVHVDISNRKQGEEWLRLLGSSVEQANESIVITDAEVNDPGPRIIFVNPAYTLMTGYTATEAIGKTPRNLQGPRTDRAVLDRLRGNLEKGEVFEGQAINYRKDGTEFTMEWQVTPLRNGAGKITHFLAIQRDITDRIKKEEHLRLLESAVKQSSESIIITDACLDRPGPGIVFVNRAFTEMTGYSMEEVLGKTPRILQGPKTDRLMLDRLHHALQEGEIIEGKTVNYRRDGTEFDIEWQIAPIRDASGKVVNFVALQRDITARKLVEEELSQSRERLRGILDHIPQRVFWKNLDLVFMGCNEAFAKDLGYEDSEGVIGKTDFQVQSKELAGLYQADDRSVIERDVAKFSFEEPGQAADGSMLWLRTSKVPLHDGEGRVSGILGTYEDVTGARLAKLEIQKLEAHLVQSQKLETVGKLAGGIAHEFNSILTAIIGQSELLLTDLPPASPLVKSATEINRAAGRAATLTRQLLAYGRKQLLQPEILDLNRILEGMKDMLHHLTGGDVEILIYNAGVQRIKADAGQIEQVIVNMAINARDAMPNGGQLTLETDNISFAGDVVGTNPELIPGDYVTLSVTDTGMGMSADVKARVFEPFFTTKAVGDGAGLGLSTCYGIVKQSGGHISVYSEPGRGTSFKIYLPQVTAEPSVPYSQPVPPYLPGGTETILLVEDDPALREMAGVLLKRLGYHVLEAANGIEALALKQRPGIGKIDLLFTDVVMPHMSGKELAERVRHLFPETRILFTSAFTEKAMAMQGMLDVGAVLLQKPFTPSALAMKIRQVLDA